MIITVLANDEKPQNYVKIISFVHLGKFTRPACTFIIRKNALEKKTECNTTNEFL